MRFTIDIPTGRGTLYSFSLPSHFKAIRMEVPDVVILDVYKFHDHRYDLSGFFYKNKVILSSRSFGSKKELYRAIQMFLQEYL